jgi:hypothetical protein
MNDPMRKEVLCPHGRDAHAPCVFASQALSPCRSAVKEQFTWPQKNARSAKKAGYAPDLVVESITRRVEEIKCQNSPQYSVFVFFAILRGQSMCRI